MKNNYSAWNLDIDSLSTPVDFVRVAVLAPSSHNSQPWEFHIEGTEILVSLANERRLPASDRNDRQAIISLGCAIANIETIASYHGFTCSIIPNGNGAVIRFTSGAKPSSEMLKSHLARQIGERVTNRHAHDDRPLDEKVVKEIQDLAGPGLRVDLVTDKQKILELGEIAINASIDALDNEGFRKELSAYLKPNGTASSIGMPGFGLGFPAPMAAIAPFLIRHFNMERLAQRQNETLFDHTAAILIISTDSDTQTDWLRVGQVFEIASLIASRAGLSFSPWAATVQIGEHYKKVQQALGIKGRPQFFARFGYPLGRTKHSPRLPVESVLS